MTADGSVSCPQTRRTATRRGLLRTWQRSKRWKDLVKEHAHTPDAKCVYCGRKHLQKWTNAAGETKTVRLTINHTSRHLYLTEDLYCTWNPEYMEITCGACNREFEHGRRPCPICLKDGRMNYIKDGDICCDACYLKSHPEDAEKSRQGREAFEKSVKDYNANRAAKRKADRHTCRRHLKQQRCKRGGACEYTPAKAEGCQWFLAKLTNVKSKGVRA